MPETSKQTMSPEDCYHRCGMNIAIERPSGDSRDLPPSVQAYDACLRSCSLTDTPENRLRKSREALAGH